LSIYDELFDSAIDEKGIDKVLSILRDRVETYQENIYIVSHNKSAIKANIDRIILLEKNNGKTSLIQQTD
jgi:ABC-type Mn2+/Zn2+ transport system ATPase subunit